MGSNSGHKQLHRVIIVQFLAQIAGVIVLRIRKPDMPRPFKMWLYPLPALVGFSGFVYVLFARPGFQKEIKYAAVLIVFGVLIFIARSLKKHEWPFAEHVR